MKKGINGLISLQDMIQDLEWTSDIDRYYELKLSLLHDEAPQEERVVTQIRKQQVTYMERPAVMLVIRNITFIVEFEKVKNEGKYQELLTATMSHEMLTPLNSIINLSNFVEKKLTKIKSSKEKEPRRRRDSVKAGH